MVPYNQIYIKYKIHLLSDRPTKLKGDLLHHDEHCKRMKGTRYNREKCLRHNKYCLNFA